MKKVATLAGSVALFALTMLPVMAANTCVNNTTGPFSNNFCTLTNSSNVTVNNVNDTRIINNVTTRTNTGGNSASTNTLGGNITTGNASSNITVASVGNVNTTNVTVGLNAANNVAGNIITGPSSNNTATLTNANRTRIENSNTATVDNIVVAESNTGDNRADTNTGPANIRTGNAWQGIGIANHVNDNATMVAAGINGTGNNTVENSTTGPFSNNFATLLNNADVAVNNVNDLRVQNLVTVLARTGANSASTNTLGGDIWTGNANAGVSLDTQGNINTTDVALAMGGFSNNDASNGVTGPNSSNVNTITNARNAVVDNWNNKCRSHNADDRFGRGNETCDVNDLGVINIDTDVVDAGNNTADTNTGGGSVLTGMADLWKSILVHLNDSLTVIR